MGASVHSPTRLPNPQSRPASTLIADKYRLGEELGRGAYGQVFRGLDTRTGEHVAIKQLSLEGVSDEDLQTIVNEVELLRSLSHKNVVKYLGSARTPQHLFVVLEYMENGSLASVIKQSGFGPFPEPLVAVYVQQVLQGLAYLHERGVVHRDIKGANILTNKDGVVKLADFGVAAHLEQLEAATTSGREIQPAGSPYWMAPEVVQLRVATPAADIWSVGALAIELLTGDPPYGDLQPMSALYNIVSDPHPPIPADISANMADFLKRCFARDPRDRPSARELLQHQWVTYNRRTLRSTWSRTRSARARTGRADAHASVTAAVERLLSAEEADAAAPPDGADADAAGRAAAAAAAAARAAATASPADLPATPQQSPAPAPARAMQANGVPAGAAAGANGAAPGAQAKAAAAAAAAVASRPQPLRIDALDPSWLEEQEDASGAALLSRLRARDAGDLTDSPVQRPLGRVSAGSAGALPPSPESPARAHGDVAASVARQLASLRVSPPGERRSLPRDAAAAASASALATLVGGAQGAEAAAAFFACSGYSALDELLTAGFGRALLAGTELLTALAASEGDAMRLAVELGLLPAALRNAAPEHEPALRLEVARLARVLCARDAGARGLVAAGGLPDLVALLRASRGGEPDARDALERTRAATDAIWALLRRAEQPGWTLPVVSLLRRLAFHGLAEALIAALPHVLAAQEATLQAVRDEAPDGVGTPGSSTLSPAEAAAAVAASGRPAQRALSPMRTPGSGHRAGAPAGSPMPSPVARASRLAELASGEALASAGASLSPAEQATARLGVLLTSMINLLAALVQGDPSARARVASPVVLRPLFSLTARLPAPLALTVASSVRRLTADPVLAEGVEAADGVAFLVAQLARVGESGLTTEALVALHRLCVPSRDRQEQAAVAGAVPFLCRLAMLPRKGADGDAVHELSVALLCSLARSSSRCRAELWAHDALSVMLHLLKEEAQQPQVLEALAAWLAADQARVEARLVTGDAITRLVTLLPAAVGAAGESDNLAAALIALYGLLDRSPRLATELAQNGLTSRLNELLRRPSGPAGPPAVALLGLLVRRHPRPAEFAQKYRVQSTLGAIAAGTGTPPGAPVRVSAQTLLDDLVARGVFF